jgi:hypothetical protein
MAAPTIIMEFKKVQQTYPDFAQPWKDARDKIAADATTAWGQKFGGLFPNAEEFGETTIRPRYIKLGTATARETWERSLATGWKTAWANDVIEDVYISVAGFIIPEAANKVTALQFQGGGAKTPVVNVDGLVDVFEQPIVVFSDSLTIAEEKPVQLDIQSKFDGTKAVQPWGPAVAKKNVQLSQSPT